MALTVAQVNQLLRPINPRRVLKDGKGHSHVSQQDVLAHLTRVFGFGGFDIAVLDATMIFEDPRETAGKPTGRWDVCYRAMVRLTVRDPEGSVVGYYENGSTATAQNQTRGDAHDLAYKSAISLSVKRAAIALGDGFGLSLYNKGQMTKLVGGTLVGTGETVAQPDDIAADVEQQVSLGNDEVEHADQAAEPTAAPTRHAAAPVPGSPADTARAELLLWARGRADKSPRDMNNAHVAAHGRGLGDEEDVDLIRAHMTDVAA
jgi:hypothetical protein